ncbi:MAG: ribbon-helix-helix domain-containing protein [Actinomycetota bacterium]
MEKTTLYLPADLKAAVAREARHRGVAEAVVIREAIAAAVRRPSPRGALFASDKPFADRAEGLLAGFGER